MSRGRFRGVQSVMSAHMSLAWGGTKGNKTYEEQQQKPNLLPLLPSAITG